MLIFNSLQMHFFSNLLNWELIFSLTRRFRGDSFCVGRGSFPWNSLSANTALASGRINVTSEPFSEPAVFQQLALAFCSKRFWKNRNNMTALASCRKRLHSLMCDKLQNECQILLFDQKTRSGVWIFALDAVIMLRNSEGRYHWLSLTNWTVYVVFNWEIKQWICN